MTAAFEPADAAAWIAHGRPPALARSLAEVWRRHPDLPASSPADSRLARMRDRAAALRPVIDAMRTVTEAERHVRNFAFTAARSEEHTSELQSLMRISYAVFCLKKKKENISCNHTTA